MSEVGWFLEGTVDATQTIAGIQQFPFLVGRKKTCGLRLQHRGVSQEHAELSFDGEQVWVRDLESTNGTFVNSRKIKKRHPVKDGDVISFASLAFELKHHKDDTDSERTAHGSLELSPSRSSRQELMVQLLQSRRVDIHFQPIVRCSGGGGDRVGWEALARGGMLNLPTSPVELLQSAQDLGRVVELSELMRVRAIEEAQHFPPGSTFFLNCHPLELGSNRLVASMATLRALAPQHHLVLEIHEQSVTNVEQMMSLSTSLAELGIRTAFDDFGAAESRLMELAEVTPAFVKFDKSWTNCLVDPKKQKTLKLLTTLVNLVLEIGGEPVCEGVETAEQAAAIQDIGFTLGQGYFYGRPAPARTWPGT